MDTVVIGLIKNLYVLVSKLLRWFFDEIQYCICHFPPGKVENIPVLEK
jgi:hypothetical protein